MELTMPFEYPGGHAKEEVALSRAAQLDAFLREVEARAFRIAQVSVRDRDDALDIVQESMIRLATKYGDRPADQWPPLFFRILTNRCTRLAPARRSAKPCVEFLRRAGREFGSAGPDRDGARPDRR